ncbi:MAG: hypothetical protein JW954_05550 [Dehalococcoidaceae bacterium]|nr:hypothetical protein [Dehalococcoidaceae bacterium]
MNKMHKCAYVVTAFMLSLLALNLIPLAAQGTNSGVIAKPLSPEGSSNAYDIPLGSTIYHLENNTTEVYGPDKVLLFTARDTDAQIIETPGGLARATHVHHVPSGSYIETIGNVTKVYSSSQCILTVINQNHKVKKALLDDYNPHIEYVYALDVDDLSWCRAKWDCPSDPPSPGEDAVNYIFNAVEPSDFSDIIQPVVEWNYGGSSDWSGAAWKGIDGDYYRATPCDVSAGDDIWGVMTRSYNVWYVYLYNYTDVGSSYLTCYNTPGSNDLAVFCDLEGWNIEDDDDVPGDIEFYDIVFKDSSNSDISFEWNPVINPTFDQILSNLDVDCDQTSPFDNSWVNLYTDN